MGSKGRIGLFGGSFDPVHTGHLILAQAALDYAGLGKVLFIPTAVPPHKDKREMTSFEARKRMVELAIEGNDGFGISLIERKETTSFTYETVRHYAAEGYGREELHLIVGVDSLRDISGWRNPEEIFASATIIAMERPGSGQPELIFPGAAVILLSGGSNSISSSLIRKMLVEGRSVRYLVPDPVIRYIEENSLYSQGL